MGSLQEGIYYEKGSRPGQSIGIMFLRTKKSSPASEIGRVISRIWDVCADLKNGILTDFRNSNLSHPEHYRDLTVLIGYGPKIFELTGTLKKKPELFSDLYFSEPNKGGGSVFTGSDLSYHPDITENHAALDDIVIQFISDSAFVTNQCVVEIWRELSRSTMENDYSASLSVTKYYDGFRRADNRNWQGFHDGVSNLKYEERKDIIGINASQVKLEDKWTIEGTFMGFIRMYVDLPRWWQVERSDQELMVGRDKMTGCPLIGINESTKKNIVIRGCPIPGTKEVTDDGNEIFRNRPRYGFQTLSPGVSDNSLRYSHIAEAKKITGQTRVQKEEYQIFRQGYEFLEKTESYPGIRAGLNFISFQDRPIRLFNTLVNISDDKAFSLRTAYSRLKEAPPKFRFNSFIRAGAAGIFFVPPQDKQERFPGANIFMSTSDMKKEAKEWTR